MNSPGTHSILIYDGQCNICITWVNYWKQITRDKTEYHPYQEVSTDYPNISIDEFKKSIQLIDEEKNVKSGAEAVFSLLRNLWLYQFLYWCYQYIPGFSWISELTYDYFSKHRKQLSLLTRFFWGKNLEVPAYDLISWLFIRGLAIIYLAAFISISGQIIALVGSEGILPLNNYLDAAKEQFGAGIYFKIPTIFWIYQSNIMLQGICLGGIVFSLLLFFNIRPQLILVLLYISYLSIFHAGQTFLSFQWDILLLEAGFLAIFLPKFPLVITWLYRWLLFRFMFLGGIVKIASADPAWDNLTALFYHFETQPLPTPLSIFFHQLPERLLISFTALTLIIELILPFFLFLPRKIRFFAGYIIIFFEIMIILTGNYNFFNLLTIFICLFLYDDAAVRRLMHITEKIKISPVQIKHKITDYSVITAFTSIILITSLVQLMIIFGNKPGTFNKFWINTVTPFHIANTYGPFAIMTTRRIEVNIEGSNDGKNWMEYKFKYKPVDQDQQLKWIIPHQPRLDWQMWFAALSNHKRHPWFGNLMVRILQGNPEVLGLFKSVPFPDKPPVYVRAVFYLYTFSKNNSDSNKVWDREYRGIYYPSVKLK